MSVLSSAAELLGICLIAAGLWMFAPWLGMTVAGVLLVGFGVLADPRWADRPNHGRVGATGGRAKK